MKYVLTKEVNNRELILAIDYLYRENMKLFEINKLLPAASKLIDRLSLPITDVPIESYYTESEKLTEYFLKIRTLQNCSPEESNKVRSKKDYNMISQIMSSEIFGFGNKSGFFPQRLDSLYYALLEVPVDNWSIEKLTEAAYEISKEKSDISLVGIAASIKDSVVLTALRETVALYGSIAVGAEPDPPKIEYVWNVDPELENKANRFIETFNSLTNSSISKARPENAEYFYSAFEENKIEGRCIFIGIDDRKDPIQKYHWAVKNNGDDFIVEDFWSTDIWTTERYRSEQLSF